MVAVFYAGPLAAGDGLHKAGHDDLDRQVTTIWMGRLTVWMGRP